MRIKIYIVPNHRNMFQYVQEINLNSLNSTEEYDGTNWTSGGNLTTTRRGFAGSGTLTAGIVFSGFATEIARRDTFERLANVVAETMITEILTNNSSEFSK